MRSLRAPHRRDDRNRRGGFHVFEKVEDSGNLTGVQPFIVKRRPTLFRRPDSHDARHGFFESALDAPEAVVYLFHAVQADPDVGKPDFLSRRLCAGYQVPLVEMTARIPLPTGIRPVRQVGPHQRLPARKEDDRRAERGKVVQDASPLRSTLPAKSRPWHGRSSARI